MATNDSHADEPGFGPFFRSYTRTWIHHVATAGLTAFGTLTFINQWFALLALASYAVPPVVLYVRKLRRHERQASSGSAHDSGDAAAEPTGSVGESGAGSVEMREKQPDQQRDKAHKDKRDRGRSRGTVSSAGGALSETKGRSPETTAESVADTDETERSADEIVVTGDDDILGTDTDDGRTTTDDGGNDTDGENGVDDRQGKRHDRSLRNWHSVDAAPDDTALFDVVSDSDTACAVGSGGLVIGDIGDGWTVLLEDGPAAQGNTLHGVDATSDGEAIWMAGDSGALGRLETGSARHTDYTAPAGQTDNLAGIAVGGPAGAETVLLINGSGEVLRGQYDDGTLEWDDPLTPGSGSSLAAVALVDSASGDDPVGYCCDTNDGVFETLDGGRSFDRIGLEGADGTLAAIATAGQGDCLVGADDGVAHRYDGPGTWTPERVAADGISGLARSGDGERTLVCTAAGDVYERSGDASDWERIDIETSNPLHAISLTSNRAVAVGDEGLILESVPP